MREKENNNGADPAPPGAGEADSGNRVCFLPGNVTVPLQAGETVLAHARGAGVEILAPCGGEGRCGKCRVAVAGEVRGGEETGLISPADCQSGVRLACRCVPLVGTVTVTVLPESRPARLAAFLEGRVLEDEDAEGEHRTSNVQHPTPNGEEGRERRTSNPARRGPTPNGGKRLGLALDLGTSTLAGAVVDLGDGRVLARAAVDNPQMSCGEDLISRIVYGEENPDGFSFLTRLLLRGIEALVAGLRRVADTGKGGGGPADHGRWTMDHGETWNASGGEIVEVVAAGNTVISHLLLDISPAPIRRPPYRPVMLEYPVRTGAEIGVGFAPAAPWRVFPSIGGFVGGDIAAGILAAGLHRQEGVALLFDVGTNGEVVLGNRDWRIACSSSAGPAFEGGEVACGMRAYPGAIESIRIDPGTFQTAWTTIGGGLPAGICGSGIIDLCAELFRTGLIDRAGQFVIPERKEVSGRGEMEEEKSSRLQPAVAPGRRDVRGGEDGTGRHQRAVAPGRRDVRRRDVRGSDVQGCNVLGETERGVAYTVVAAGHSRDGVPIEFTAADIKSVLRTKAALCAAADSLLQAVGLPRTAVEQVYIAGGFGNFIDLRAALTLGAFPPYPLDRFIPLGNASLAGAISALRRRSRWEEAVALAPATAYHDLSSDPGFMELYQRALFIPHTDAEAYRGIVG